MPFFSNSFNLKYSALSFFESKVIPSTITFFEKNLLLFILLYLTIFLFSE